MANDLYAVIDVGSNSVRLMLSDGKRTLSKDCTITKLADGQGEDSMLCAQAIERTALTVSFYYNRAVSLGATDICAFGTAALRKAKNKDVFIKKVYALCGLKVCVVSGEDEAELGFIGASGGKDGGVIDIGGASSEIIVKSQKRLTYSKSLNVGCVSIDNACGQNVDAICDYLKVKLEEYGNIPPAKFYAIGGTATSVCAIAQGLKEYSSKKVDGYELSIQAVKNVVNLLKSKSEKERNELSCLQKGRGQVILGGAVLLEKIMEKAGINSLTVSEKDNLEGYLIKRLEKL